MRTLIELFAPLDGPERREMLAALAESLAPPPSHLAWDVAEVRHDPECSDAVGIFLKYDDRGERLAQLGASVGPGVRTMTRALLAMICQGMSGEPRAALATMTAKDLAPILGPEMMALRSGTADYVTRRFREAAADGPSDD